MKVGKYASQGAAETNIRKYGPSNAHDALLYSFQLLPGIDSPNCYIYNF